MVKLFVEGGGDSKALRGQLTEGFTEFLKNAGFKSRMPRIFLHLAVVGTPTKISVSPSRW